MCESSTHTRAPHDTLATDLSPIAGGGDALLNATATTSASESQQPPSTGALSFQPMRAETDSEKNNQQLTSPGDSYNTPSYSENAHYNLYVNKPELGAAKIRKYSEWAWRPAVFVKNADVGVGGRGNYGGYGAPIPSDADAAGGRHHRRKRKGRSKGAVSLISCTPTTSPPRLPHPSPSAAVRRNLQRAHSVGDLGDSAAATPIGTSANATNGGRGFDDDPSSTSAQPRGVGSAATASPPPPCLAESATSPTPKDQHTDPEAAFSSSSSSSSSSDSSSDSDSICSERTVGDDVYTSKLFNIPTSGTGPEYFAHRHTDMKRKLLIIMVGLPAQGKTFLAQKLCRLLGWNGFPSQVLNIQVAWRERLARHVRRSLRKASSGGAAGGPSADTNGKCGPFGSSAATTPCSHDLSAAATGTATAGPVGSLSTPTSSTSPRAFATMSPSGACSEGCFPTASMVAFGSSTASTLAGSVPHGHGHGHHHHHHHHSSGHVNCSPSLGASSTAAASSAPTPAQFFKEFLSNPASCERRLYTEGLREHYSIVEDFYKGGGHVMILNDDFPTRALRQEAASLFAPLVDNIMYVEVRRNTQVNLDLLKMQAEYSHRASRGMTGDAILDDFSSRVRQMEEVYEPLDPTDPTVAYVRLLDSSVLEAHRLTGFLQSRIVSFLMNLTQVKISHPIYFCRHGQSEYNLLDRLGGDPNLTERGRADAEALYEFVASVKEDLEDPAHMTDCTPRLLRTPANPSQPTTLVMECSTAMMYSNYGTQQHQQQLQHSRVSSGVDKPAGTAATAATAASASGSASAGSSGVGVGVGRGSPVPQMFASASGGAASACDDSEPTHSRSHSIAANSAADGTVGLPSPTASAANASTTAGGGQSGGALYSAQRRQLQTRGLEVWTSQLRRTIQTAMPAEKRLGLKSLRLHSLNEIHAGVCEGMTYREVKEQYPLIHRFRGEDKFTFRYPGGESYQDLVARLEPVIMELENANRVVVVVAHQAVLRGLLAYFGSTSADESVHVEVPHRTVWRCTYDARGTTQIHSVKLGPKEDREEQT